MKRLLKAPSSVQKNMERLSPDIEVVPAATPKTMPIRTSRFPVIVSLRKPRQHTPVVKTALFPVVRRRKKKKAGPHHRTGFETSLFLMRKRYITGTTTAFFALMPFRSIPYIR